MTTNANSPPRPRPLRGSCLNRQWTAWVLAAVAATALLALPTACRARALMDFNFTMVTLAYPRALCVPGGDASGTYGNKPCMLNPASMWSLPLNSTDGSLSAVRKLAAVKLICTDAKTQASCEAYPEAVCEWQADLGGRCAAATAGQALLHHLCPGSKAYDLVRCAGLNATSCTTAGSGCKAMSGGLCIPAKASISTSIQLAAALQDVRTNLYGTYNPSQYGCCPHYAMRLYGMACSTGMAWPAAGSPSGSACAGFTLLDSLGDLDLFGFCMPPAGGAGGSCSLDVGRFLTRMLRQPDSGKVAAVAGDCRGAWQGGDLCTAVGDLPMSSIPSRASMTQAFKALVWGPAVCPELLADVKFPIELAVPRLQGGLLG